MDADGGHRRRPRRGPRADRRQRGGRARHVRDDDLRSAVGDRPLVPPDSMAGQRRRALDSDHPRVGIRDRREGAHRDEPAGHRHRDVGGGAAHAGRQGGGERPRGRSGAGCRRPLDRSRRSSASVRPVPLGCAQAAKPPSSSGQEIFTIGAAAPSAEGHDVWNREPRRAACDRVRPQCLRPAALAARSSPPAAAWSGSPRSWTRRTSAGAETPESSASTTSCDVVASAEKKMKDAAPPDGTHLPVEPVRPFPVDALKDAAEAPRGQPEPVPDVLVRLRHRLHHARADLRRAVPVGAVEASASVAEARARGRGAGIRAPAHGLQQLVRVRCGLSAGAAGPRDAEAGGGLLDEGGARRRADTGRRPCRRSSTSSQASRGCARSAATPR